MAAADAAELPCVQPAVNEMLALLFEPMAQLISPALLHVTDSSSSFDPGLQRTFTTMLGICAKCTFDSDEGE
jgi:hypothetical protein